MSWYLNGSQRAIYGIRFSPLHYILVLRIKHKSSSLVERVFLASPQHLKQLKNLKGIHFSILEINEEGKEILLSKEKEKLDVKFRFENIPIFYVIKSLTWFS